MSSFSLLNSFSSESPSTTQSASTTPATKTRKINKRFSFHQKQQHNVKECSESNFMGRDKKSKSHLSRRWSSLKQYQPTTTSTTTSSQQSLATGNCSISTNPSPLFGDCSIEKDKKESEGNGGGGGGETTKKKWEVIEHYSENLKGRETVSSSLLAVSSNCDAFHLHFKVNSNIFTQAGITTFNLDSRTIQMGAQRTSFTSKSCASITLDNVASDCTGYSTRNSVIDSTHNGDTNNNNNFNIDYTIGESESECDENSKGFFSMNRLKKIAKKKISPTKFKNIQIEMLYQRYLLRMNQNNATHIVWLLFALILVLAIIHIKFLFNRWDNEFDCSNSTLIELQNENVEEILMNSLASNLTTSDSGDDEETNNSTTSINKTTTTLENRDICINNGVINNELLSTNIIQFSLLGLCSIVYTILLLCLYKQRINEIYLFHVSYAIIISLVIIDISFSITNMGE